MPAFQKGSITASGHKMLRETYGEERWNQALEMLDADDQRLIRNVEMSVQYPLATEGRLFTALCRVAYSGDRFALQREFHALGRKQADTMLDGVFSVFARILSPQTAFSKAGSMISATYTGVTSVTEPTGDGKGGVIFMRGLGEAAHLAPWICGWMERALERFGAKGARVRERAWESGQDSSDELAFEIRWM